MFKMSKLQKPIDKDRKRWYNNKAVERERAREKKNKNFFKKRLDKFEGKWYNIKVVSKETGIQKKFEKTWKKYLTNWKECGKILKLFRSSRYLENWTMLKEKTLEIHLNQKKPSE